jgi:pyridoxine 5-phosphate synthase
MARLSVNLNKVALLRNSRRTGVPDLRSFARIAIQSGAQGITVHPRPDERHIRRTDVFELEALLRAEFPDAEYNIEGFPSEEFLQLVEQARPDQVTFVPDSPEQSTSDHGWDIAGSRELLERAGDVMKALGVRVSLFVDADPAAPAEAMTVGAGRIELYTGPFAANLGSATGADALNLLSETAHAARAAANAAGRPLGLNAGHDLTLENLATFIEAVPDVDEVSIGHGIIADALLVGFPEAVRRYRQVLASGR